MIGYGGLTGGSVLFWVADPIAVSREFSDEDSNLLEKVKSLHKFRSFCFGGTRSGSPYSLVMDIIEMKTRFECEVKQHLNAF